MLSIGFLTITLEFGTEKYYETILAWLPPLAILMLIPISLYTSKTKSISFDEHGNPLPVFSMESKKRQSIGKLILISSISIFFAFMLISLLLDTKLAYEFAKQFETIFIAPLIILMPLGFYLSVTNQCPYCCKLNSPKDHTCGACHNPVEEAWILNLTKNT